MVKFSHLESKEEKFSRELMAFWFPLVSSGFMALKLWLVSLFNFWFLGDPPGVLVFLRMLDVVLIFFGVVIFFPSFKILPVQRAMLLIFSTFLPSASNFSFLSSSNCRAAFSLPGFLLLVDLLTPMSVIVIVMISGCTLTDALVELLVVLGTIVLVPAWQ